MTTPVAFCARSARSGAFMYAHVSAAVSITTWHAPTTNGSGTKHAHRRTLS